MKEILRNKKRRNQEVLRDKRGGTATAY